MWLEVSSYLTDPHEAIPSELPCLNRWPFSPEAWRNFQTGWIFLCDLAKSVHVVSALAQISLTFHLVRPVPSLGNISSFWEWHVLYPLKTPILPAVPAWLIRMKGSSPAFDPLPSPLHCALQNHCLTEFESQISISSRASCVTQARHCTILICNFPVCKVGKKCWREKID